jgi:hypothetical protein
MRCKRSEKSSKYLHSNRAPTVSPIPSVKKANFIRKFGLYSDRFKLGRLVTNYDGNETVIKAALIPVNLSCEVRR